MSLLQAYQAELLIELDEVEGFNPSLVWKLRRATDLSLRAAKEMAKSIGRSMAALVTTKRHLWLNLSNIKGKDKNFLMDAPISPSGFSIRLSRDSRNQLSKKEKRKKRKKNGCIPETPSPPYSYLRGCWAGAAPNI